MHVDTVNRHSLTALLSDEELARAAGRWGKFTTSLTEKDKFVLDRVAAGDSLKAVCFDLTLSYEAVQKRMTRWQQLLGVKSTGVMLHVWATVRGFGKRAEDPTLLRYADLLRRTLGYDAPTQLPPAAVEVDAGNAFVAVKSAASSARERAAQNTLALISPALWRICLVTAREGTYDTSRATGLPALHEWFRCCTVTDLPTSTDRLASILSELLEQPAARQSMFADEIALLIASQNLAAERLSPLAAQPAIGMKGRLGWFSVRRSVDSKFWQTFVRAVGDANGDSLADIWRNPEKELLLDPVYGFAAASTFFRARDVAVRAAVSPVLNLILSTRQHWATLHHLEPTKVLHRQACYECGMSVVEAPVSIPVSLPVLTAEQLLPSVQRLATYASA